MKFFQEKAHDIIFSNCFFDNLKVWDQIDYNPLKKIRERKRNKFQLRGIV